MLDEVEVQEAFTTEEPDAGFPVRDHNNDYLFTTLWLVSRKRVFYRDTTWLHRGGNLVGVTGRSIEQVKKFMQAHDELFGSIKTMEFSQGGSPSREIFLVFDNRSYGEWSHKRVDAAFDMLLHHFTQPWLRQQHFVFEHAERYRR